MTKKILVIGDSGAGKTTMAKQVMMEKYGKDVVLVTQEEAKEQGLSSEYFANTPTMKIEAPPILDSTPINDDFKSGREKRRERRKNERKLSKK